MFGHSKSTVYKMVVVLLIGVLVYVSFRFTQPDYASANRSMTGITSVEVSDSPADGTAQLSAGSLDNALSDIPSIQSPQVQQANGIAIELNDVQKEGKYVQAAICYQLPSDADWLPGNSADDVVLTIDDKTIPMWGVKLIDWKTAPDGTKAQRCDRLWFPVAAGQDLSHFTVTIKRLVTSVPEQPDCNKVQEKLTQARTGVLIQCNHVENPFGYTIEQKPTSISEGQVHKLVYDAFSEIVQGPWVFTTGLK